MDVSSRKRKRMEDNMNEMSYNCIEDITEDIKKAIGWRIQEKRIEKGMAGADLGAYLNITANQISRIERGCANLDVLKLLVICNVLGTSADYIIFGKKEVETGVSISNVQYEAISNIIKAFS